MRQSVRDQKAEWDRLDRDVKARELSRPIQVACEAGAASTAGGTGPDHTEVKMQHFRQIDDAELNTEDAIQTEKLKGILEVERKMNELRAMNREFGAHVEDQQVGLNTAETNIDKAQDHVEKGVKELKSANKLH